MNKLNLYKIESNITGQMYIAALSIRFAVDVWCKFAESEEEQIESIKAICEHDSLVVQELANDTH